MKKLLAKKRDNKGFSLVELIVVILIMAVIAVALAPQVMKWVGTSKENTDKNNIGQIESAVNAGVADYMAQNNTAKVPVAKFMVGDSGLEEVGTVVDSAPDGKKLKELIEEAMNGKYPKVQQDGSKKFQIEITDTGKVTVTVPGIKELE
ncbi:MAG: type II secretion system GspH family protein [Lachnospiraceae bacterium]|nr:type II secretion system GspH family protein [Lachnospiraceae bacterium]